MKTATKVMVYLLALTLCFALIFTGCTQEAAAPEDPKPEATEKVEAEGDAGEVTPPEEVTITMWHNFGADIEAPYFDDTILGLFKEFSHITVDVVDQGNDQYKEMITTAFATGTTPDLARLDSTQIAAFANQEALMPLDQFEGFEDVAGQLFDGTVHQTLFKGRHYAFPLSTDCKAAVCNMDLMGELGFTAPPETMEQFIEACQKVKPNEYMISVSGTGDWDFYPYLWWFGGEITDPEYTTATGYANGEKTIAAVTKLKELHDAGVFTIRDIDGSVDAWEGMREAKYAMFLEGPWFYGCTEGWEDMNILPSTIPTYNGQSATVLGGQSIVMFTNTEHPEETFELMKFLVGEEAQHSMFQGMKTIPVNTKAAGAEEILSDPIMKVYLEQMQTARCRIPSPYDSEISEAVGDELNAIFYDEISIEEGLNNLAQRIDAVLQKD